MPNHYIGPARFVGFAVAAIERDALLPNLLIRSSNGAQFKGSYNDTVSYKLPGIAKARDYEWRTRTNPIVFDEIFRTKLDLHLDTHTYTANSVTDEELTLDVTDFSNEILLPMTDAIVGRLNSKVLTALAAAPFATTNLNVDLTATTPVKPLAWALGANSVLDVQGTPKRGRKLYVGTNVLAWLMQDPAMVAYDQNQATTVYREATFGRIAGFDVISDTLIGPNVIYALHESWAVMFNVQPDAPAGLPYSASVASGGYGFRIARDYSLEYMRDRTVLSTFTGINSINDEYKRFKTGDTIPTTGPNAGAVIGDPIIGDGTGSGIAQGALNLPVFTGKNIRGAKGTFTPAA